MVGTVRPNRKEIPGELTECFLLSSMHNAERVEDEDPKRRPEAILLQI